MHKANRWCKIINYLGYDGDGLSGLVEGDSEQLGIKFEYLSDNTERQSIDI